MISVAQLYREYDWYNLRYWDGKLPFVSIRYARRLGGKDIVAITNSGNRADKKKILPYEIVIHSSLKAALVEKYVVCCLLHEMCHVACNQFGRVGGSHSCKSKFHKELTRIYKMGAFLELL